MQSVKKLTAYLRESKDEIKRISWPSRKDTVRYSILVIVLTILTAVFFGGLDIVFKKFVAWLIG
ncbi:preprotein translocase subunit SecE [Candidatus Uhrbacteria bacterium RIFCSPHIGHO2_02_FULL_53_13]|uniref:Protein translocase subunit SecE n=2 Tax=Candidatus Uhriibacteriota TaxID=1752732 RepID=A0A1F7TXK1_9BACT|nr:MAG: preprotein translocase subunit SecE [Candidatus Uhrbacteria bacterium RIFCSPHIGHO2_02_FULL_53_13]OGL89222.1 MAG: preprotein translocase subunit SecE [Candidatus Uhrbacteria bacterium RIFCSPLOWO2_02_FULL_53_10]